MIAVHQPDVLGFGSLLEHLRATAQFQIFDQGDGVSIGERIAMSVFDDACCFRSSFSRPFMAADRTFPVIRMGQHVIEGAGRAGRIGHGSSVC